MFIILKIFQVISSLSVISYNTPGFLFVIIPISIIYYFILHVYIATSRQLTRLEAISRSPIYSHFKESINGVHTIRAYSMEQRSIDKIKKLVDLNSICKYPCIISKT